MDNITHSMTGAIAAKFIRRKGADAETTKAAARPIFWLLVASVNFPDLDVIMAAFGDPILSIKTHRWITHSILAAPLWAMIPAAVFYRFSSLKNFRLLWLAALSGILLHIACDLVTPYGTMLLAPFSNHRFTLSSMFIVDLYFSGGLIALLLLGRYDKSRTNLWRKAGLIFALTFIAVTLGIHEYAAHRVRRAATEKNITATKVSALPQPLSIFRWVGLVQTNTGVYQTFFSVFDDNIALENLPHAQGKIVDAARQHERGQWYMQFAHHPLILAQAEKDGHSVEIRDLQFNAPPKFVRALGLKPRRPPFTLLFRFDAADTLKEVVFNPETIHRETATAPQTRSP